MATFISCKLNHTQHKPAFKDGNCFSEREGTDEVHAHFSEPPRTFCKKNQVLCDGTCNRWTSEHPSEHSCLTALQNWGGLVWPNEQEAMQDNFPNTSTFRRVAAPWFAVLLLHTHTVREKYSVLLSRLFCAKAKQQLQNKEQHASSQEFLIIFNLMS